MNLFVRDHNANAADGKPSDAELVRGSARDLRIMVESVSPDEFFWQEAHYDHDSREGRKLLFLMANHEWVRATSEIIDITRADELQTMIKVDIDLGQITHEAFRRKTGKLWLPVAVLPPQTEKRRFEPDLFATVTDPQGNPVPILPADNLRQLMSAAMAEIIATMAVSYLPGTEVQPGESFVATRDQRLVLSAAIYRMLRHGGGQDAAPPGYRSSIEKYRITQARNGLLKLLDSYIGLLEVPATDAVAGREASRGPQFAPELTRRAIKILQALTESMIIAVLIDYEIAPSVLTVHLPARKLQSSRPALFKPWTWSSGPAAGSKSTYCCPLGTRIARSRLTFLRACPLNSQIARPSLGTESSRI
jgi:hypothetical protein